MLRATWAWLVIMIIIIIIVIMIFNQHFGSGFTVLIAKTDASKILQKK